MTTMKRILSLLLVLMLTCSMLATSVFAEGSYTETNSYVLNYNGEYEGSKWQYFSPYWPRFTYEGADDYTQSISFSLYDTKSREPFPVYCTDIGTALNNDSDFRRLNLEDSTYAAAGAGLLRSIVLKGFPNTKVADLGAAAGVDNLTVGEAVAATQAAVWQIAHGNRLSFTDFCRTIDTEWTPGVTAHYDECNAEIENGYAAEENEALIESHIQAVFTYLTSLEPTAPAGIAVSNNSFASWSDAPVLEKNEDGTYNVTVEATVDVEMTGSDALTLTAVLGDYSASASLKSGENTKTLTIAGVPAEQVHNDVILNIDGQQTVSDVFLFDAVGERGSSQSLIGMLDNQLPVHAEVVVQAERVINIHKTTPGENRIPLEGIQFDIYFVADRTDYLTGKIGLPNPDIYENKKATYTIITDAQGKGSLSLTKNNLKDGVYLVVERKHSAIVDPVPPFFVILPATSADGTHLEYVVDIHPKNDVVSDVLIEKDVVSIDNNEASVDATKPHTWIIEASIPGDLASGKSYVISDTLDARLDYAGNMKVQVESADGTTVYATLTSGVDYIVAVNDVETPSKENGYDSFTVALTAAGRKTVANAATDGAVLRIWFDAQINSNASVGEEIPNQAEVDYTNSVGVDFEMKSDVPEVYTGGVSLEKVDAADPTKKLEGAVFQVYRKATEAEVADENIEKTTIGDLSAPMVLVHFYGNAHLTGDMVTEVTSGVNGSFGVYGLAYGTYYLMETQAPAGYNLSAAPIEVTINETSHQMENIIRVTNNAGATLPETGGMGTTIFYIVGGIMVVGAVILLVTKKRMSE